MGSNATSDRNARFLPDCRDSAVAMAHAEAHHLDLPSTLSRLADIELEQRFQNAIALRWRQSKLTDKLTIDPLFEARHDSWRPCCPE